MAIKNNYLVNADPDRIANLCGRFYLQYARSYLDQHSSDFDFYSIILSSLSQAKECFQNCLQQDHEKLIEIEIVEGYVCYTMRYEKRVNMAEHHWQLALNLLEIHGEKIGPEMTAAFFHRIRHNQGNLDFVRKQYLEAIEKYNQCLRYYMQQENYTRVCDIKKTLGDCCRETGQYQAAAQHYLEYLEYEELSTTDIDFKRAVRDDILENILEDLRENRMDHLFEITVDYLHNLTNRTTEEILTMILKYSQKVS